jgi:hypothetical protein
VACAAASNGYGRFEANDAGATTVVLKNVSDASKEWYIPDREVPVRKIETT